MNGSVLADRSVIRQAVVEVASLPEDDLPLVIEFLDYLKQQRQAAHIPQPSAADIRLEARRRAIALKDVPRSARVARFERVVESIRAQAIAQGTAAEFAEEDRQLAEVGLGHYNETLRREESQA